MRHHVATVALAALLLLTGCTGDDPTTADGVVATPTLVATPEVSATPLASATAAPTPTATASTPPLPDSQRTLQYFLVRTSGERLWVEPVTAATQEPPDGAVARAAFEALLAAPATGGLTNPVPQGTTLLDVSVQDGLLTLDLSSDVTANPGLGAEGESMFQQVLAHTGTQFSTVDRVRLLVEGQPVSDLWGHLDWSEPFEADPFVVVPIHVAHIMGIGGSGAGGGSVELSGTANVFEAVFLLELLDRGGNVIETMPVMASCGTGCRGEFEASFTDLEPDTYTVRAHEEQIAEEGEGPAPFEVSIDVTVP